MLQSLKNKVMHALYRRGVFDRIVEGRGAIYKVLNVIYQYYQYSGIHKPFEEYFAEKVLIGITFLPIVAAITTTTLFTLLKIPILENLLQFTMTFIVMYMLISSLYTMGVILNLSLRKSSRFIKMERELLYAITLLYIVSMSGMTLEESFKEVSEALGPRSVIAREFMRIYNDVTVGGKSIREAVNDAMKRCPSPNLQNMFAGLIGVYETATSVVNFLETFLNNMLRAKDAMLEKVINSLLMLSNIYLVLVAVLPISIYTMALLNAVMPIAGISSEFLIVATSFIILPLIAIVLYVIIDATLSKV